jgi:hypothetical protein
LTAYKSTVKKTRTLAASQSIIQMELFTAGYLSAYFIAHIMCGFLIQIQTIHTGEL